MARRGPLLGLVGGLLMAASLFLPLRGGAGTEGQLLAFTYCGEAQWLLLIPVFGLVALSLLLSWARPAWAWAPASVWLVGVVWEFGRVRAEAPMHWPDTNLPMHYWSPWPWVAACIGGLWVLRASLNKR